MIATLLVLKLFAVLTKDMVNLDSATRALTYVGQQLINVSSVFNGSLQTRGIPRLTTRNKEQLSSSPHANNWLHKLLIDFQKIILWINPTESFCTILGCLIVLYILAIQHSFYTALCSGIFLYNFLDVWFNHVWPEIKVPTQESEEPVVILDPQLMTPDEFRQTVNNLKKSSELLLNNLLALRQREPFKFCLLICTVLSCTAFIGRRIDGLNLLLLLISIILCAPGIYLFVIPQVVKDYLKQNLARIYLVLQIAQEPSSQSTIKTTPSQLDALVTEPQEVSQLTTSGSPSKQTTMSLIEHLKNNSFIGTIYRGSVGIVTNVVTSNEEIRQNQLISRSDQIPTEVPNNNSDENQIEQKKRNNQDFDKHNLESKGKIAIGSDDLSSTDESTSLVDLDEDQQDDFVML